jgi:hypothetical protein
MQSMDDDWPSSRNAIGRRRTSMSLKMGTVFARLAVKLEVVT